MSRWFSVVLLLLSPLAFGQTEFDYRLDPRQVAKDTWVVTGLAEDITRGNGGNIANAGFIVTAEGVVLVDTGPTLRFGQQLRSAIARVTDRPVVIVFNTHHHPDHFLGNQAFPDALVLALPATRQAQRAEGPAFSDNIYRMAGDWASGTEVAAATEEARPGSRDIGQHQFEVIALNGHTASDLALIDRTTGVLFAGDLVFLDRAPATPHARIADWLDALDRLQAIGARLIVPGHGPTHAGSAGIDQTRDWLRWLDATLRDAVSRGLDMAEAMQTRLPPRFESLPLARREFERSVAHLYVDYEIEALGPVRPANRRP